MKVTDEELVLLTRFLDSPEDELLEKKVTEWRKSSDINESLFQQYSKIWMSGSRSPLVPKFDEVKSTVVLKKYLSENGAADTSRGSGWMLWIAAAVILLVSGFSIFRYFSLKENLIVKTAPANAIDSLTLSDGSIVYLDKGASVKYAEEFKRASRKVYLLKGNAFFKIQKDQEQPFIVGLDDASVKVLGTSFNIFKSSKEIRVCVKTGTVQFQGTNSSTSTLVHAGEAIRYEVGDETISTIDAVNENSDSWLSKQLVFEDASLNEVVKKIETFYQVKIDLEGDLTHLIKFNARFSGNSIAEVLEVIRQTYPVTIQENHPLYTITINNSKN